MISTTDRKRQARLESAHRDHYEPALVSTVAAMDIAVSSGVMIIQSLRMVQPSMVGGHPKTMTRFGNRAAPSN